jgi:hypothetical protein
MGMMKVCVAFPEHAAREAVLDEALDWARHWSTPVVFTFLGVELTVYPHRDIEQAGKDLDKLLAAHCSGDANDE